MAVLLAMLTAVLTIVEDPVFQRLGARLAAGYFSEAWKTEVKIEGFQYSLSGGLKMEGVMVKDQRDSVLLSAENLSVILNFRQLLQNNIHVRRILIDNGEFQLVTHKGDSTLNLQFILDYFASTDTTPKPPDTNAPKWNISGAEVQLADFRFHFQDENAEPVTDGMDYANIDVRHIFLKVTNFSIDGDTINASIPMLMAQERCGFNLLSFSGEFRVSPSFIKARNLKILSNFSDLSLDFSFNYDGFVAFNDFLDKVRIKADISPSLLDLRDIGYFAPEVKTMADPIRVEGDVEGTVTRFHARKFRAAFGDVTRFEGDIFSSGLPDVYQTYVDMNIKELTTNRKDLDSFLLPGDSSHIPAPSFLDPLGTVTVRGSYVGFWDDFRTNLAVKSEMGEAKADLKLQKDKDTRQFTYEGNVDLATGDLGTIVGMPSVLRQVGVHGYIKGKDFDLAKADIQMDVVADSIGFNGYLYRHIHAIGTLSSATYNGTLAVRDPSLGFDFSGMADFHDSIPSFDFMAKVAHCDLFNLGFLRRDSLDHISGNISGDFKGSTIDNIDGRISISRLVYQEGEKTAVMDTFSLYTDHGLHGTKTLQLTCDFMDANINGDFRLGRLSESLERFIRNYLANFQRKDSLLVPVNASGQLMKYLVEFRNTDQVTAIFAPFLRIGAGAYLSGYYDENGDILSLEGKAPLIKINDMEINDWELEAETRSNQLTVRIGAETFYLVKNKPGDSLAISLGDVSITSVLRSDSILFNAGWTGPKTRNLLAGFVDFSREGLTGIKFSDFRVRIRDNDWSLSPGNYVEIDSTGIRIDDFSLASKDQGLALHGKISGNKRDTLYAHCNNLNISDLDYFLASSAIDIDGILSGDVRLADLYGQMAIRSDLELKDFKFNKEHLGDAFLKVDYISSEEKFLVDTKIIYTGNVGQNIPLAITGAIYLGKPKPRFDLDIQLKNLNLKTIYPFMSSFMSRLTGLASGEAKLTGPLEEPELAGQIKLMRTEFAIGYLNVPYSLSDVIEITKNQLLFKNITLYDSLGNKATLNGNITHHNFSDIQLDLDIDMNDFAAFSNGPSPGSLFYGKARASGNVKIVGTPENIGIYAKATTGSNTHMVIPINLTADVSQIDYIMFEKPDTATILPLIAAAKPVKQPSGFSLKFDLKVTPDASVEVFLPDQMGNISAKGTGNITLAMTPTAPFTVNGTFVVTKGDFLFQLRSLLRLPFTIKPGSQIGWTGDVTNADMSISASYKTKVPLAGLTTDQELASMRVPVEVIIRLNGKLMNPQISFGMNMPNADESLKTFVYTSIDTTNQAAMAQQMLYVLVMNAFQPVKGTGPDIGVSSTAFSLVTNQINSWVSGLSKNVNVGINYNPGSTNTGTEFDVGISTQFLDDRLLVDGTFGMTSYKNASQQSTSTIVGDINIEYILTKNRRWRARAFNQTNPIDILNNNSPYTQGLGLSYQREFSNFRELFTGKDKKARKDKKNKPDTE